jgi:AraC-like DNA-binding protein
MDLQSLTVTEVNGVTTVYSPKGRRAKIEHRATYGFSLCACGKITYTQNGVQYVEDRTHAVILPQGQSYSLYGDAEGYFPVINFSVLEPLCDTITVIELQNCDSILKSYEKIKKLFATDANRAKILSLFYDILGELLAPKSAGVIDPAIRLIGERYFDPSLTNTLLSERCGISEVYLRKLFKSHLGQSPKQYIIGLRLKSAKLLLMEDNKKIWEIAECCGFESNAHFCRIFKEQFGTTPSEYRKNHRVVQI